MSTLNESTEQYENRLIQVIEGLPVGVSVHDSKGVLIYINQVGKNLLKVQFPIDSNPEKIAQSFRLYKANQPFLYPVHDLPMVRALQGENVYTDDIEVRHPNRTIPLEVWASSIFNDAGDVLYAIAAFQDISDRKRAEEALKQSEIRFRNLAENVPGAIFRYVLRPDYTDAVTYMSPGCLNLWEVDPKVVEENAHILWEMVHPEDFPAMQASVLESARTLQPWSFAWRITTPSGRMKWLEAAGRPARQENGDVVWDSLILDISHRKYAEAAVRESEARYRLLAENINDLVCLHNLEGHYIYLSPSCRVLLGYEPNELIGINPYDLFHPEDCDRIRTAAHGVALSNGGENSPITYRIRHKSGHYIWLETLTKPILDEAGQVTQLQTTSRDVTERICAQERLRHEALHDSLTELPNRTHLIERLELAIKRAKRHPEFLFSVLFLDLDRFKMINDSLGHLMGDSLLVATACRLKSLMRETDLVARLSGDEFVILLEDVISFSEIIHIAQRITREMRSPLLLEGREVFSSASIGIVLLSEKYQNALELLRDADIAMYRAKSSGGACYAVFDPVMHTQVMEQMQLESDLRKALKRQEFFLQYQPIVSLETGDITSLEALVRWQHPEKGIIAPNNFIPTAEESRFIHPIGLWVLQQACEDCLAWRQRFPALENLRVSVNLSVGQIRDPSFTRDVQEVLSRYHEFDKFLTLEITESMLIQEISTTIALLTQFKNQGIKISIDDFGTGYSSLSYLHQLPVDTLKIDRAFIHSILSPGCNSKIVDTIITLSNSLELAAIAEGIETPQQLAVLKRLGCEQGQGHLFSRALDREAVTHLLSQPHPFAALTSPCP